MTKPQLFVVLVAAAIVSVSSTVAPLVLMEPRTAPRSAQDALAQRSAATQAGARFSTNRTSRPVSEIVDVFVGDAEGAEFLERVEVVLEHRYEDDARRLLERAIFGGRLDGAASIRALELLASLRPEETAYLSWIAGGLESQLVSDLGLAPHEARAAAVLVVISRLADLGYLRSARTLADQAASAAPASTSLQVARVRIRAISLDAQGALSILDGLADVDEATRNELEEFIDRQPTSHG